MSAHTKSDLFVDPIPSEHYFDDHFIEQVRRSVLAQPTDIYDQQDLECLRNDNWFIRRSLAWRPTTIEEASKAVEATLAWRKQINLRHWKESDFPSEFFQIAACFEYLPDRAGQPVLVLRLRCNRRDPQGSEIMDRLVKNYFIYTVEKIVTANRDCGFALIFDCHKASITNVDLNMARFLINTLANHYAGSIAYVCIYELPWIFNQVWRLIRSWLDDDARRIIKFASSSDICQIIEPAHLPDYMGGVNARDYRFVPKGVNSIDELAKDIGLAARDVTKISAHLHKLTDIK